MQNNNPMLETKSKLTIAGRKLWIDYERMLKRYLYIH